MIARIILILSLLCVLNGQNVREPLVRPLVNITGCGFLMDSTAVDTISAEELFLREISDAALAKEAKKKVITNRILVVIIAILLVDKFVK